MLKKTSFFVALVMISALSLVGLRPAPAAAEDRHVGVLDINGVTSGVFDYVPGSVYDSTYGRPKVPDRYTVHIPVDGELRIDSLTRNTDWGFVIGQYVFNRGHGYLSYPVKAGTYTVQIVHETRLAGYPGAPHGPEYTLKTTFTPTASDNKEPSDTYQQAQPIQLNQELYGHLGYLMATPAGDYFTFDKRHWYVVTLPQHGKLSVDTTYLMDHNLQFNLAGVGFSLYELDPLQQAIHQVAVHPTGLLVGVVDVPAGTYYLQAYADQPPLYTTDRGNFKFTLIYEATGAAPAPTPGPSDQPSGPQQPAPSPALGECTTVTVDVLREARRLPDRDPMTKMSPFFLNDGLYLQGAAWSNYQPNAAGNLDGNGFFTNQEFVAGGTTFYTKFQVDGTGRYLAAHLHPKDLPSGKMYTTSHSWDGTLVIAENTLLYQRLTYNPDGTWSNILATDNYDDQGGTVVHQQSGTLTPAQQETATQPRPFTAQFGDNYGGTSTAMVVLELVVVHCPGEAAPGLAHPEPEEPVDADVPRFSDLPADHWAFASITAMVDRGILSGYPDGTFRPNNTISRAEFAKIMVLTLGLEPQSPPTPTFADVGADHWAYDVVEGARAYLTGFRDTATRVLYFEPSDVAVREDVAVAIVKARGLDSDLADRQLLDPFPDRDQISPALRDLVALAVEHGFMRGTDKGFEPLKALTRAEACVLLYRILERDEAEAPAEREKVPF